MRYSVHLSNATIKLQLSSTEHAQCLKHFGQKVQLRLFSGELYSQGHGWYLVMLNEESLNPKIAAHRFLDCIRVALRSGDSLAKSRQFHAELAVEVRSFQKALPRRVVVVDHIKDHGRTVGVVRSRVVSALANRDAVLTAEIKRLMGVPASPPKTSAASPAALQALASNFNRK